MTDPKPIPDAARREGLPTCRTVLALGVSLAALRGSQMHLDRKASFGRLAE